MVSSRMAPSFRAVITSITEPHDYEKIIVPWNIAMTIFQPHLENILMKNGMNANEILELFNKYINRYDDRLYKLMMKIIYDYSEKGFPTLWNRNPTLGRSSILMLFIGDIKKDVNDPTVSMSIGLVVYFNAKVIGHSSSNIGNESFLIAGNPLEPCSPNYDSNIHSGYAYTGYDKSSVYVGYGKSNKDWATTQRSLSMTGTFNDHRKAVRNKHV